MHRMTAQKIGLSTQVYRLALEMKGVDGSDLKFSLDLYRLTSSHRRLVRDDRHAKLKDRRTNVNLFKKSIPERDILNGWRDGREFFFKADLPDSQHPFDQELNLEEMPRCSTHQTVTTCCGCIDLIPPPTGRIYRAVDQLYGPGNGGVLAKGDATTMEALSYSDALAWGNGVPPEPGDKSYGIVGRLQIIRKPGWDEFLAPEDLFDVAGHFGLNLDIFVTNVELKADVFLLSSRSDAQSDNVYRVVLEQDRGHYSQLRVVATERGCEYRFMKRS